MSLLLLTAPWCYEWHGIKASGATRSHELVSFSSCFGNTENKLVMLEVPAKMTKDIFLRSAMHVERQHGRRQKTQDVGGKAQLDRGCGAPPSMDGQHGVRGRHSSG